MDQELREYLERMEGRLGAKIDGVVDSLIRVMSDMEGRLGNQMERLEVRITGVEMAVTGINRTLGREMELAKGSEIVRLQQQRAIDELTRRVTKLEGGNAA
jgi:uncharacterized coiled-coil protein SlyX